MGKHVDGFMLTATQAKQIAESSQLKGLGEFRIRALRKILREIEVRALAGETSYVIQREWPVGNVIDDLRGVGYKVLVDEEIRKTRISDIGFEDVPCTPYKAFTITISWGE